MAPRELTNSQLELNQEMVLVILECQRDTWDDKDMFGLIDDYFETSFHTLKFCSALDKCLTQAQANLLILQLAVRRFKEEEKEYEVGIGGIKFAKTLRELKKFKAVRKPFNNEFSVLLKSVSDRQSGLLEKLQDRKKELDKKLNSAGTWRRLSKFLFVTAFVSALIFSVVAVAKAAPPVVTAFAGVLTIPIGSVGKWVNSLWKEYQKELKGQRELLGLMGGFTRIVVHGVENIRALVDEFENDVESLMKNAEVALEGDEAVSPGVGKIMGKIEGFMKTVYALHEHCHKCSHEIRMGRTILSQRLISNSNGG